MTSVGSLLMGIPSTDRARHGLPPMAYTSLIALAAAMRPKCRGLSTMGMKKSVVTTMAWWSFSLYLCIYSMCAEQRREEMRHTHSKKTCKRRLP